MNVSSKKFITYEYLIKSVHNKYSLLLKYYKKYENSISDWFIHITTRMLKVEHENEECKDRQYDVCKHVNTEMVLLR